MSQTGVNEVGSRRQAARKGWIVVGMMLVEMENSMKL
jgi:hypothetical protein